MVLNPKSATLLSLAIPGAAHFALGRPGRGALALVSTLALFLLGWSVLGERLWFFAFFTPFDWLAPAFKVVPVNLLPEGLNVLGAAIASFARAPTSFAVERLARMPVAGEHWAAWLTGASGVLSVLWAADAHWLARGLRGARTPPAFAALVSWLVPGAGHALAGQKAKGMLMGAAVVVVFVLGLAISQGHAVDRAFFGAWWAGASLFGTGTLFASLVTAPMSLPDQIPDLLDFGVALCTCAGLMNAMVMSDAYTVAERTAAPPAPSTPEVAA